MLFEQDFLLDKACIWALICLHDVIRKNVEALTDHFAVAFVRKKVARVSDVVGNV